MNRFMMIEWKRIFNRRKLLLLMIVMILASMSVLSHAKENYKIFDASSGKLDWKQNLEYGKQASKGKYLTEEYLLFILEKGEGDTHIDKLNVEALVSANYNKELKELNMSEIKQFYKYRIQNIKEEMENNPNIKCTQQEQDTIIKKARKVSVIPMDYAEGWKVLNENMGNYSVILLFVISFLIIPLFGNDSTVHMRELYRSTRYGKKQLDHAKILFAYLTGSSFYIVGILIYFLTIILNFGAEGASMPIQSQVSMFFSTYGITYIQQFLWNLVIGCLSLLLTISLMLLVTIVADTQMVSAAIWGFFWILLYLFQMINVFAVNHLFANFMPLRMNDMFHYYVDNEYYHLFGHSVPCLNWIIIVSILLIGIVLLLTIRIAGQKRNHALK
ncbi:MAG: hypothetical protein Q4D45_08850 [Lachnospiraceae bacterium]|nr:hypothetical protein [Lachnospiraceae bacterium]